MRTLILRGQPTARARVQAVALSRAWPEIELALARQGGPGGEGLEREWQLGERPARGLLQAIRDFSPDLIHSHGPIELAVCANELTAGRIPVIHDTAGRIGEADLERRAIEESAALVVPSQELLEQLGGLYQLPSVTCVFPDYPLAHELSASLDGQSAEANVGLIATLYEQLAREPLTVIAGDLRSR